MTEIASHLFRAALPPIEAELAAWRTLSRVEQLARYWEALRDPGAGGWHVFPADPRGGASRASRV